MPLSEASILQKNQGNFDAATGNATLGAGTSDGSTVLLVGYSASGTGGLSLPTGFEQDFQISAGTAGLFAWRRKDCPVGESSWGLSTFSTLPDEVIWFAYEIAGVDLTEPLERSVSNSGVSLTTLSTGTTSSTSYTDLMCLAIHCAEHAVTTISGQTNGFQDTASAGELRSGSGVDGSGTVAVSRLFPGAGGTFECTATFGATVTGLAAMLVYRAVGDLPQPPAQSVVTG